MRRGRAVQDGRGWPRLSIFSREARRGSSALSGVVAARQDHGTKVEVEHNCSLKSSY